MKTILIADDHRLIRDTWSFFINQDRRFKVIGTCPNAEEAVQLTASLRPDIILMDINLKPFSGIEATRRIRKANPETRIIAVTMHNQIDFLLKIFEAGAMGYVTKNSSSEEMIAAMLEVSKGNQFVCAEMTELFTAQLEVVDRFALIGLLTEREREIIDQIKLGRSSREIAAELFLSTHTVDAHRHNLMKKLKVKNVAALIELMHSSEIYY